MNLKRHERQAKRNWQAIGADHSMYLACQLSDGPIDWFLFRREAR
jgi:hypothetical protein